MTRHFFRISLRSIPVAEDTEKEEEQVDEIKIKIHRTHRRQLVARGAVKLRSIGQLLDLLRIPCGKTDEKHYAHNRDYPLQLAALQEQIHNHDDDKPEKTHHQIGTHAAQIAFRQIAVDRHRPENARCYEERIGYRTQTVRKEYRRHPCAHKG